jgi:hypothetical protein
MLLICICLLYSRCNDCRILVEYLHLLRQRNQIWHLPDGVRAPIEGVVEPIWSFQLTFHTLYSHSAGSNLSLIIWRMSAYTVKSCVMHLFLTFLKESYKCAKWGGFKCSVIVLRWIDNYVAIIKVFKMSRFYNHDMLIFQ